MSSAIPPTGKSGDALCESGSEGFPNTGAEGSV